MARPAFTFAVLFFLFAFSGAHLQVYSTENDVTDHDSSKSMPVTDSNPAILLPSEKPESADESASAEIEAANVDNLVHVTLTEPGTFVSFRPINRHFRVNRQFPLRYTRRRPCRHFVKPVNPRSREISYGNDMILSNNNNDRDLDPEVLFRDQVIPSMALRFPRENHHHHHRGDHRNEFMPKYVFAREKLKRPFRREEEEREKKEQEERENGGFVKRFRKFLNHF